MQVKVDCHYDRWFVVQSVDNEHPVSKLSPLILDKAMRSAVGTVKTIRCLRNGDFLLEVSSAVQSRIVNKLDNVNAAYLCNHEFLNRFPSACWLLHFCYISAFD